MVYKNKKELIDSLVDSNDVVLDVGFWGQGVDSSSLNWPHKILQERAKKVFGIDLDYDEEKFGNKPEYMRASAEDFDFKRKFDVIFAGDIIEHLPNPGLFLDACKKHLEDDGRLIITTPNTFNLFNLAEKISKPEPTVNADHTMYLNSKTIKVLLRKKGWNIRSIGYIYSLDIVYAESWKKKILNLIYKILSLLTPKFIETLVVVAEKNKL